MTNDKSNHVDVCILKRLFPNKCSSRYDGYDTDEEIPEVYPIM